MAHKVPCVTRDIRIPKMGMGTGEVDVITWLVQPGASVEVGTPLVEIESEKSTVVLEADTRGILVEILVPGGEVAEVGTVIGRIQEDE